MIITNDIRNTLVQIYAPVQSLLNIKPEEGIDLYKQVCNEYSIFLIHTFDNPNYVKSVKTRWVLAKIKNDEDNIERTIYLLVSGNNKSFSLPYYNNLGYEILSISKLGYFETIDFYKQYDIYTDEVILDTLDGLEKNNKKITNDIIRKNKYIMSGKIDPSSGIDITYLPKIKRY